VKDKFSHLISGLRQLPLQKVIAVDLGAFNAKVLLIEKSRRGLEVLNFKCVNLQEEGLINQGEVDRQLNQIITEFGCYPLIIILPQHNAISEIVNLTLSSDSTIAQAIHDETTRLTGLSESGLIYDYKLLQPSDSASYPVWITVATEKDLQLQLNKFKPSGASIFEVTTTSSALISAWIAKHSNTKNAILVDIGATGTTVAMIRNHQGVSSAHFPIGGESFTETIARFKNCSFQDAEYIKRNQSVKTILDQVPGFINVIDTWCAELLKLINEWKRTFSLEELNDELLPVIVTGGGSLIPGFIEHVQKIVPFKVQAWPQDTSLDKLPPQLFTAAYGAVVQSFSVPPSGISLLPEQNKILRKQQHRLFLAQTSAIVLTLLCAALCIVASTIRFFDIYKKIQDLKHLTATVKVIKEIDSILSQKQVTLNHILPVIERQFDTRSIIGTFALFQSIRQNKDLWFVLVADELSYTSGSALNAAQKSLVHSNAVQTNLPLIRVFEPPGSIKRMVAELSIPDKGGERLKPLNEIVTDLKKYSIFSKIDFMPQDQRTNLVDMKLVIPERYFAILLEFTNAYPLSYSQVTRETNSQVPLADLNSPKIQNFKANN